MPSGPIPALRGRIMKLRVLALAGVALAGMTTAASAGEGWYLGLGAGWNHLEKFKTNHVAPLPSNSFEFTSRDGYLATVTAGYKFDSGMRVEEEFGYANNKSRAFKETSPAVVGPIAFGGHS